MCNSETNNLHKTDKHSGNFDPHSEAHKEDHAKWSRRSFLSTLGLGVLGGTLGVGNLKLNAMSSHPFLEQIAQSQTNRVLVLIQLSGGNDGLNTIIPFRNDIYYQKRPTIAITPNDAIKLNDEVGMHPALEPLRALWDQGSMNVANNVGYQNQDRSHSRSTSIWTSASNSNMNSDSGWIGRFMASEHPNYLIEQPVYPLGVRIGGSTSVFESEFGNLGVTFGGADQFARFLDQGGFYDVNSVPNTAYGRALAKSRQVANDSFKYLEAIENAASNSSNLVEYPDSSLAESLAVVARMIRGQLGTKVFLVSRGGFDTHNGQGGKEGPHANILHDVASSIAAFYEDLAADNKANEVLAMTFSEFGRTLDENGNGGTDHGSSAPVLTFGPVKGGVMGEHANLQDLDNSGDPLFGQDYRSLYQSILLDWFELDESAVQEVLGSAYASVDLIDQRLTDINQHTEELIPSRARLVQNYPNPFNPNTQIRFELLQAETVLLEIFSMNGQKLDVLLHRRLNKGNYSIPFNAQNLPSGTYIYRLSLSDGYQLSQKMTYLK